jgi:hypothetical protein
VPAVFISHSSKDDALATTVANWLESNGFTDFFVDHTSIRGGDKWRDALRASIGSCRVLICIVTDAWLESDVCDAEFEAIWLCRKRILPLFLVHDPKGKNKERFDKVRAEDQGIDFLPCLTETGELDFGREPKIAEHFRLALLAAGALERIGLDPMAFEIDRLTHPDPFPGLASFGDDDADASLFFGRSREIFRGDRIDPGNANIRRVSCA